MVAKTIQRREYFAANEAIKEDIADVYSDLVGLVGDIAIYYRLRLNSMTSESVTIDFDGAFGKTIDRIWAKKEHLSNHIWRYKLRQKRYSLDIEAIRAKLSPADDSLKTLLYGRLADKSERLEGTCEWIQPYLLDFFRGTDSSMTITGAAGCGKSMLAGWIVERLRRQLGRKSYETITHTFAGDAPAEATPIAFLKNVLFQLLERNVGDAKFYETIVKAYEDYSSHNDLHKLETSLWIALEAGLKTVDEQKVNLVIIIDGLDEILGRGESAAQLHKRLHEHVDKFSHTRAITLSRPVSHLGGTGSMHLVITPDHNHDDVVAYYRHRLTKFQHFKSQSHATAEKFIEGLMAKAKGSFLEPYLASKILATENSYDGFFRSGNNMPHDVHGLLSDLIKRSWDLQNATTRHLVAFMLASERPLTIAEMEDLLSINLEKRTINSHGNLRKHITFHCSGLIVERKGLIRFKHSSIRNYFKNELSGKSLMSMKEAHAELTKRLLFYAKHTLTVSYEPSFEIISGSVIHDSFHSHGLLEYVIRNWIGHFRSSTFCHAKDELNLSAEFKEIFPDSVFFAMIEWSCWQNQYTITEATHLHDLTLRIRTACFGEKHRSVLQSLIILGSIHRSSTNLITAAEFFYRASCIGQVVLHKFSTVVVSCTHIFLTCTESIVIKERTKIVNYREEMIIFMIEICKTKHGKDSDQVIKWYEILAELYVATKEEHRAVVIYKELYDIVVIRFGKSHPRCRHVAETLGGLKVVLKDGEDQKDVVKYDEFIFETCDEMDESDELRISIILRLCHTYERAGKWILAEKLYINLWRRISELCRIKATVELHIAKINIAIAYLRFLEKTKRTEEATNILICLWAEYEHHSFESETIIIRLKEIGVLCKSFGLLTIAVSVLSKVWGWFKGKGKTDHEEAISTTILITEVVEEVVKTITITKKTTQTTTIITETITREVFETTYERCKRGKVDGHFFKACIALVSLYIKLEKWSECEIVIKKSLELTWKSILTIDAKVTLSGAFVKECVLVATQLAICYHRQKYFEKAEELYLRIYRACLQSFKIDHECVTESAMVLIRFYEEYHRHDKVIEIYIELLNGYKKHCGVAHKLTIRTLYALGSICLTLGRKDAYDYYIEIVTVLNKGGHCHHDAFEAALIVCQYYYETQKWVELRKICVTLWETFIHHHNEFKFTEAMIITLYERYVYVLEFHAKVEFSVLYKISLEYRETVTKHFGASAAIVITAMIALAKVCEKHEEHWHESVTIYEEVIKRTKTITTMTTETIETITITAKKRLSKVYITIITKGKSTTTTTFEKALAICLETYEHLKIEFGCWHEKTLIQLKEIVIIYKKLESYTTIIRMLEVAVVEIITKTKKSIDLYHAAATLASIYISMGMAKQGHELLHQLRHLIVLRDFASSTEITIKLGSNVSKVAFVFLIAFEQGLVEKVVCSYSEVMADIILETYLYEQYTSIIKTETRIEVILEVSARLRSFWFSHGRKGHCEVLDKKLFAIFKTKYGSYIKTQDDITFIFYVALLTELSKDRSTVDFGHICCITSYQKVKSLVEAGDFIKAHEVAKCSFQLIKSQKWYHSMQNIAYGYKVAELLAGIDCRKPTDKRIHENMLETSRQIVIEVLASCRAAKINFVSLRFEDVAGLVRLLGDQENYGELEVSLLLYPRLYFMLISL